MDTRNQAEKLQRYYTIGINLRIIKHFLPSFKPTTEQVMY